MAATTKVYQVVAQDYMIRHWHFATKREAKAFAQEWLRENNQNGEFDAPVIDCFVVALNARGVAKAMNDFIDYTCANEG